MGDKELGAGAVASVKQEIEAVSATTMLESAAALEKRARRGGHGMSPALARNVPCIVELVPIEGAAHEGTKDSRTGVRSSLCISSWSSALSRW